MGGCILSAIFELESVTPEECLDITESYNSTGFELDRSLCTVAQQKTCDTIPVVSCSNNDMQRYLDCQWECIPDGPAADFSRSVYAGVCEGIYRVQKCPHAYGTLNWDQCHNMLRNSAPGALPSMGFMPTALALVVLVARMFRVG